METVPNKSTVHIKALPFENGHENKVYKWDIYWPNTIGLILLHGGAIYGYSLKGEAKPQTNIFAIGFVLAANLGFIAGMHRLWCHRTYKVNLVGELVLLCMASPMYIRSIYHLCRDHRLHHKYSETDADPHNANRGLFFNHMGWLMVRKHPDVKEKGKSIDVSDLKANPLIMFQHNYYVYVWAVTGVLFPILTPYYCWGETLKIAVFRATIYTYIAHLNIVGIINTLGHASGYRPYDKNIGPADGTLNMLLGFGEGFHNYHHTFPWDYRNSGVSEDARNLGTLFIDLFACLGLATERKKVPQDIIEARIAQYGDGTRHDTQMFEGVISKSNEKTIMNIFYAIMIALVLRII